MLMLSEKDFINESWKQNPKPMFWMAALLIGVAFVFWIGKMWHEEEHNRRLKNNPFLNVTNRALSAFLWQHPEFMRANVKTKTGYLPGFVGQGPSGLLPEYADEAVEAPPELLFLFHTWDRIVTHRLFLRLIPQDLFLQFLDECPFCDPDFWPSAPQEYKQLVQEMKKGSPNPNLTAALPDTIKLQFQGWRNYRLEGDIINSMHFSAEEITDFLKKYPEFHYSLWKNIYGTHYPNEKNAGLVEIPAFLKTALYNQKMMQKS